MTGIFDDSESGELTPYYMLDGSTETQPSFVYVNLQDGNGEQQVWPSGTTTYAYLEDWDDGTTGWSLISSGGSISTQTANPVSAQSYVTTDVPSDAYGYVYINGGYAAAENWNIQTEPGRTYQVYLRSGAGGAGNAETQFQFNCQHQGGASPNHRYRLVIYNGQDDAYLYRHGSSRTTLATNTNVTVDSTEWCLVEIQIGTNGGLEVRIKNVTTDEGPWTISATDDTPFGKGGVRISTYEGSQGNRTDMDGLRRISGFTI